METVPEVIKAYRDFSDSITVEFKGEAGKDPFKKNFSLIRGGVCWPNLNRPAYLCAVGRLNGFAKGSTDSMLLIYERTFETYPDLVEAAANTAKDLRFNEFFTDMIRPEWKGFNSYFAEMIRSRREFAEIRLKHSLFADDFRLGFNILRQWAREGGAFHPPIKSLLVEQTTNITEEDLKTENLDKKFEAINAMRYVAVAFDRMETRPRYEDSGPRRMEGWT